jgi:hypothetical protein
MAMISTDNPSVYPFVCAVALEEYTDTHSTEFNYSLLAKWFMTQSKLFLESNSDTKYKY